MRKAPETPRFRLDPTRLTPVAQEILEVKREVCIPAHQKCRREGFMPVGSVSEYDRFILRAGKIPTIQAVRQDVGERVRVLLEEKYRRRGQNVEICYEKGAVLLKGRRKQKEVSSPEDFTYHPFGMTFYIRENNGKTLAEQAHDETLADLASHIRLPLIVVPHKFSFV